MPMFSEPGFLSDFSLAARTAWDQTVRGMMRSASSPQNHFVVELSGADAAGTAAVDWNGFPARVEKCLESVEQELPRSSRGTGQAYGLPSHFNCNATYR